MYEGKIFKRKNDYSVIVFMNSSDRVLKYNYVNALNKFARFLTRAFPDCII